MRKYMNHKKNIFLTLLLLPVLLYGCYNRNAEDLYPALVGNGCDTTAVTYTTVIKPIMDAHCATSGCHLGATYTGYDLSGYTGIANLANNGKLVAAIEHTGPNPMPQGAPKLDDCTISKIKIWINAGALNN